MDTLDLFAGTGWGVACQRLGIQEYGVEKMPQAVASRDAAGMVTVGSDVWDGHYRDVTGLIASPPCQTFSAAGKGKGREALDQVLAAVYSNEWKSLSALRSLGEQVGDERTALVLTPLNYWHEMRPEWVAFEQVPTVLPVWEACADVMRGAGYSVWTGILHAERYGVPQTRKRAFLLASRALEATPPGPTHSRYYPRNPAKLDEGMQKWVSMAEALLLNDLVDPGSGDPYPFAMRSNYGTGGDASNRGVRSLDEPAPTVTSKIDRNKWLIHMGTTNVCDGEYQSRGLDHPAPTITSSARSFRWGVPPLAVETPGIKGGNMQENRAPDSVPVTVEEAAVLQSYPADFPWRGSKSKQYLQVGNAVPPLLAEHVLSAVAGLLMSEV